MPRYKVTIEFDHPGDNIAEVEEILAKALNQALPTIRELLAQRPETIPHFLETSRDLSRKLKIGDPLV